MQGAYEVQPCADGRSGQCVQQMAPVKPIEWQGDSDAYALLGDTAWSNYTVTSDVDIRQAGHGRALRPGQHPGPAAIRPGRLPAAGLEHRGLVDRQEHHQRHHHDAGQRLGQRARHRQLAHPVPELCRARSSARSIDGAKVGSVTDSSYQAGLAGIGVTGYQTDQFDNLNITPGTGSVTLPTGPVTSGIAGQVPG